MCVYPVRTGVSWVPDTENCQGWEEFLELDIISQNPALADSWSRAIVLTRDSLLSLLVRCWSQIVELSELREMALS